MDFAADADVYDDEIDDPSRVGPRSWSHIPPFLRWVGSKRRYAVDLAARMTAIAPGCRYVEPFLGSGAVALARPPGPMLLADACKPLGYLWWWIQRHPEDVAEYAAGYGLAFEEGWNTREGYAAAREEHNNQPYDDDDWRPSARFLWIMCACFNGVYRENRNGYFNVPWGHRQRVSVPTPEVLRAVANHIADADVRPGWDFEDVLVEAGQGDVIFADPPYDGDVMSFTSYVATPFDAAAQERLCDRLEAAVSRGAIAVSTNADTPRIRKLYRAWAVDELVEARPVAADPQHRSPAHCLIMTKRPR